MAPTATQPTRNQQPDMIMRDAEFRCTGSRHWLARALFAGLLTVLAVQTGLTADDAPPAKPEAKFEMLTLRGRVVWLAEAMARRHGVKSVPEAATRVLALESPTGDLHPLAEDIRGRGFRRDERLRNVDLELLVRRYRGAPVVQVIGVFERTKEAKVELDYWCDICAIAMYELKPCDCCQGPIELRRRDVPQAAR